MLDLQLAFGLHDFAALNSWIEGRPESTQHPKLGDLDRPVIVPSGDVLHEQSIDEQFMRLETMKLARRHQLIDYLRDLMAGYPWLVHEGHET